MNPERVVVVTGAAGFIGGAVVRSLVHQHRNVRPVVRVPRSGDPAGAVALGDLAAVTDAALANALDGAYAVLHFAGLAHVGRSSQGAEARYQASNVVATRRLARAALRAGVARFILASTVKVNGELTRPGHPFRPDDAPDPVDSYARSKRDAETTLFDVAQSTSMAPIVLRLPLTYGPGAKGNFARLTAAVAAGHALPLRAIDNRRSLLSLRNLERAATAILESPAPPSGIHFVADADSVSTPRLVEAIAQALGRSAKLYAIPVPLLRLAAALVGRRGEIARLVDSLEVDSSSLVASTGWRPMPFAIDSRDVAPAS